MRALKESVINLINIENITSSGISNKKRNYYAMILCNSKELTESHIGASSFRISNMHFKKVKPLSRIIDFYGNIENGYETRYITGRIIDLNGHEVFIKDGTVLRIGVPIEENGIYNFGESMCRLETDKILRITRYNDDTLEYKEIDRDDFYNPVIANKNVLVRGK